MRNYYNIEYEPYPYDRSKKTYRGYGANGYSYSISMFIKNRRDEQHWRAIPVFCSGEPILNMPNYIYGRTLEDISRKLEMLK